ncbi:hypothetical protein ABPG74_001775 [Tetrahymena malaccensis]
MKNIHQIFKDMLIIDNFLVLERKNKNYFLYTPKDQSSFIDQDQSVIQSHQINITLLYQEFIKFITSLTNSLNKYLVLQQMIEGILLNIEEKPIITEMIENQIFEDQTELEDNYITQQVINENSQFRISHKLQNLINNYQELVVQLCYEKDDFIFKFENPSKISFKLLKTFEFDKLPLKIQEEFNVFQYGVMINDNKGQLEKVQEILKKQKIILQAKHLELDLDLKQIMNENDYYNREELEEESQEAEGCYHLPDIPTNYIFLNIECSYSYSRRAILDLSLNTVLQNDKYRGKITIINKTEDFVAQQQPRFVKIYDNGAFIAHDIYDIFKIPSIIDQAQCYVYGYKLQKQNELKELFLEDQILLKFAVLQKNNISNLLYMSISQIVTDLFD